MTNDDYAINGWKAAEKFSFKSMYLQLEVDILKKRNTELLQLLDELRAENQRLQQIAKY